MLSLKETHDELKKIRSKPGGIQSRTELEFELAKLDIEPHLMISILDNCDIRCTTMGNVPGAFGSSTIEVLDEAIHELEKYLGEG